VTTTKKNKKNVLLIFALVCVTATKRNISVILGFGVKIAIRDKTVVCTFWCEVSVNYICKHLYFSCENVDIYNDVNIRSMEPVLWNKEGGLGQLNLKFKCLRGQSECNF